jgi:hypothetical protein
MEYVDEDAGYEWRTCSKNVQRTLILLNNWPQLLSPVIYPSSSNHGCVVQFKTANSVATLFLDMVSLSGALGTVLVHTRRTQGYHICNNNNDHKETVFRHLCWQGVRELWM